VGVEDGRKGEAKSKLRSGEGAPGKGDKVAMRTVRENELGGARGGWLSRRRGQSGWDIGGKGQKGMGCPGSELVLRRREI